MPDGAVPRPKVALGKESVEGLVSHLDDSNMWWRLTAQQLLVERQARSAVPALVRLATKAMSPEGRVHALWTLDGLQALEDESIERALHDSQPEVREQALRLADRRLRSSQRLQAAVVALADDPSPQVRFQLAFALGEAETPSFVAALAKIARRDVADPWTQLAVLSSASRCAHALLEMLLHDHDFVLSSDAGRLKFVTQLGALVGANDDDQPLASALQSLPAGLPAGFRRAVLEGLGEGRKNRRRSLAALWNQPGSPVHAALDSFRPLFNEAAAQARDSRSGTVQASGGNSASGVRSAEPRADGLKRSPGTSDPSSIAAGGCSRTFSSSASRRRQSVAGALGQLQPNGSARGDRGPVCPRRPTR